MLLVWLVWSARFPLISLDENVDVVYADGQYQERDDLQTSAVSQLSRSTARKWAHLNTNLDDDQSGWHAEVAVEPDRRGHRQQHDGHAAHAQGDFTVHLMSKITGVIRPVISSQVIGLTYHQSGARSSFTQCDGDIRQHNTIRNGHGNDVRMSRPIQFVFDGAFGAVRDRHERRLLGGHPFLHEVQIPVQDTKCSISRT